MLGGNSFFLSYISQTVSGQEAWEEARRAITRASHDVVNTAASSNYFVKDSIYAYLVTTGDDIPL